MMGYVMEQLSTIYTMGSPMHLVYTNYTVVLVVPWYLNALSFGCNHLSKKYFKLVLYHIYIELIAFKNTQVQECGLIAYNYTVTITFKANIKIFDA